MVNTSSSLAKIRLALVATGDASPQSLNWLEYDSILNSYDVIEKTGIVVPVGYKLMASADQTVHCVVYGTEDLSASYFVNNSTQIYATQANTLYSGPSAGKIAAGTVSITNIGAVSAEVYVYLASNPASPQAGEYLEWKYVLPPNSVLERSGILISNGHTLGVQSSVTNVTAICYGIVDNA